MLVRDITLNIRQTELDSIRSSVAARYYSIQFSHDSVMSAASGQREIIRRKLDSLRGLARPVESLGIKLDSVERWRARRLDALNKEVEALKLSAREKIKALELPPELTSEGENLEALIDNLDVSLPETGVPLKDQLSMDMSGLKSAVNNPIPGRHDLPVADLQETTGPAGASMDHLASVPSNTNEVSALIQEETEKITEATGVSIELNEADKITEMAGSLPDERAVKDELVTWAQQEAVNHFQGQEEQLRAAMELVAKYKKKYGSFQSLEDIASRKGNPLRGTPFIERFIPGIAFQMHRRDVWMVDFNLYASYRLYPRLSAGAGWNQCLAFDPDENDFKPRLRIFGPRAFGEFQTGEGFSARLEAEYMNTRIPPQFSSRNADQNGREWVFTTMAGVKKEFRFFKDIKGTVMLLYNLHDPRHRSPYADRLTTRFGFEFPMKRKPDKIQE